MTAILLALVFSDAALNASEAKKFRLVGERAAAALDSEDDSSSGPRPWTPGVDSWKMEDHECPAFFQKDLEGFGIVRLGPPCEGEEIPYAL